MDFEDTVRKAFSLNNANNYGISEHRIALAEKRLNILLPIPLRKFYLLFGRNKKLNINDHIFRLEDLFIEDEKLLVFGKRHWSNYLLGIKVEDIYEKDPIVYYKKYKGRENKIAVYKWETVNKTIETVLLERIINSGFYGGFRYRFDIDGDQIGMHLIDASIQAGMEGNEYLFKLEEIMSNSRIFSIYPSNKIFIHNDNWILDVCWEEEEKLGEKEVNISYIMFGTERKDIYDKISREFKERRFKIEKICSDFSEDYQISKYYFAGPTVEFSSGEYIFYPERYIGHGIYKQRGSIFIDQNGVDQFYDLLKKANNNFDIYGISTYYNKEQTAVFLSDLEKRLEKMKENKIYGYKFENPLDYYRIEFVNYRRYRKQIIKMLEDVLTWLKKPENNEISIQGI
ncbi:MAG: hypothetical protein FWH35_00175 [Treponema sp.]|nr:hypothetical protein [Treponema sp.]